MSTCHYATVVNIARVKSYELIWKWKLDMNLNRQHLKYTNDPIKKYLYTIKKEWEKTLINWSHISTIKYAKYSQQYKKAKTFNHKNENIQSHVKRKMSISARFLARFFKSRAAHVCHVSLIALVWLILRKNLYKRCQISNLS